jgi:hypothetical protein
MRKPKAEYVLAQFEKMKQARAKKDSKWKELDAFDRGDQWNISSVSMPSWIPRPVTNYIHVVKSLKKASLVDNVAEGTLLPLAAADAMKVDMLNKAKKAKWRQLNVTDVIRRTADRAILLGTGVTFLGYDPDVIGGGTGTRYEGELVIKAIDPSGFYIDPIAFDLKTARFCATAERTSYDAVLRKFGKDAKKLRSKILGTHTAQDNGGEIYDRDYATHQDDAVTLVTFYYRNEAGRIGFMYLANGVEVGHQEDSPMVDFPFAILYNISQINDFWGKSVCELVLDNQKLVNKVESIIATMGVMLQNPPTFVSTDSGIDVKAYAKYRNAPSTVWSVRGDPRMAVHIPPLPEIPVTLLQLNDVAKNNIKEIAGLTEAYMGDSVGSLTTSTGVNSLINRSKMRDKDQQFELNAYIERLTRLMVDTLVATMVYPKTFRVDNDDPNTSELYEFITLQPQEFEGIKYDFYVNVHASTDQTPEKLQDDAMQAMQMQMQFQPPVPIITNEEFINAMNWSDTMKENIINRIREDNIMKQKNQVVEIMTLAAESMNPESELYGMNTEQLVDAGLQILRPDPQKLGNVGDVQQAQATTQGHTYSPMAAQQ